MTLETALGRSVSTSTWPILAVRWSFLSSSSSPTKPSVWPMMAPMMSCGSTIPSTSIEALIDIIKNRVVDCRRFGCR